MCTGHVDTILQGYTRIWSLVTTLMQCYMPDKWDPQLHYSENLKNSDSAPYI